MELVLFPAVYYYLLLFIVYVQQFISLANFNKKTKNFKMKDRGGSFVFKFN